MLNNRKAKFNFLDPTTPSLFDTFFKYLPLAGLFALIIAILGLISKYKTKLSRSTTLDYYFDYEEEKRIEEKRFFIELGKFCFLGLPLPKYPRDTEVVLSYKPNIGPPQPLPFEKTMILEFGRLRFIRINDIKFLIDAEAEYIDIKILRPEKTENYDEKIHTNYDTRKITITNENSEKIINYPVYIFRELDLPTRFILPKLGELETYDPPKIIEDKTCYGLLKIELPGNMDGTPTKKEIFFQ